MDYKKFLEQSSALEIVIDRNFTIVTASNAFLNATGTTRENIIGKNIFDVFSDFKNYADEEGSMRASFERVIKHKSTDILSVIRFDLPAAESEKESLKAKCWRPVNSPVLDENNEVEFIIQRFKDVTEQIQAAEKIEDSNERFNRLIMQSHFGISVLKGENMQIALADDLSKERLGIEEDIVGKTLLEVLPEMKDQPFPDLFREVYTTGVPFSAKEILARIKRKDGTLEDRYFDIVLQPYRETDETISGVTSIAYEVTKLVRARKKAEENEHRFRKLIEESPIATALYTGSDHVVQYANDMMLEYWGKDKEVFGKPLIEALPELKKQDFLQHLDDVYNSGEPYTGVEKKANLQVNGKLQPLYFNFNYKALRDKEENIFGILNTAFNVTEEVIAKKSLEKREKTLRQLLDCMPQKISHTDDKGKVIFFNKQWTDDTGFTQEQLKGNKWIKTVHPDDFQELKENWIKAANRETALEVECRILHKERGYRWHLNRAVPIKDENGKLIMWVGSNTDIHEQKKQKEILAEAVAERTKELKRANEELIIHNRKIEKREKELERANKELESFAYISSHDLQEPLRKIQTFADRIREKEKKNLSDRGLNYFERMEDTAKRMRILINDLLAFSRVNNANKDYDLVDLNKIIEEVKEEYKDLIEKKNATIEVSDLCDAKVIVFQFRQLMNNLISNALKFSKPDTPPHIKIKNKVDKGINLNDKLLSLEDNYCHITIEDNGIGFEPCYSERIFEVFQQLHSKDLYEGTGIGLAIVKKIVDNHDGYITADSKPGKGTRIDIYIPAD
ncbi:hypothetical protein BH23BAC3_BH23BAC3_33480 [soil metagenome]